MMRDVPCCREVAFIDPLVRDPHLLLAGIRPGVEPILLSEDEPALRQMARTLSARAELDAIHVIAHGQSGSVDFASGSLSIQAIDSCGDELSRLGAALAADGALLLWSCDTGAGEAGATFVDAIGRASGARVAAASGPVGAQLLGGAWHLDRGTGPAPQPLSIEGMATYPWVMATFNGTNGGDVANASTGTLTGFTGGTVAELQDATSDTFNGGNGADTIVAGSGNDTINLGSGQFVAGESIEGGANTASGTRDQIILTTGGTTVDFTVGSVSGVETLTGSTGNDTVTMTAAQWAGFATLNLGSGSADTLNVLASGNIAALATPTLSGIENGSLTGTAGNDTVTLNGAQLNAILSGSGIVDLGAGNGDTVNLTSTSVDLNTLGATDNSIRGVEAISAATASAGVTISLGGQSEAFTLTGSGFADGITGGSGADRIVGGSGADTLQGGAGNDVITYSPTAAAIGGGADIDTLVVNGAATINLSLLDQSTGDTANVSGFENVNASGSAAAVSLTGSSGANVLIGGAGNDTIRGGGGNDTIDGGAGTGDTVVFTGARTDYTITLAGSTYTVVDNRAGSPDGTATVTNVERFQFSDGTMAAPNKIVLENMKQGNPQSEWGIVGDGDANIQGFATEISRNAGQTVDFKIATNSTNYRIDIYRLGYYGGDGARKMGTIQQSLTTAQIQPHPIVDMSRGLIDAGNWSVSASWQIPEDAVSGIYIAKLVRQDGTAGVSHIPFIVRDDGSTSDIVFQTSDTTWQAYNAWGGASLYYGEVPVDPADMIGYMPPNCSCGLTSIGRATAVSYNRPFITNTSPVGGTHDFIFGVEHSAVRWLEQNGYDVSYISGVDTTRSGSQLLNHSAFLSVGHDEYWSAEQRANVEAARDTGVNLAFWGGNSIYWKVRWETSIDGNGTPYRTMVTYKETWGGTPDPTDVSTGTWRDPRFADPGQKPENALQGTLYTVDSYRQDAITIPYDYSKLRFWRNTDIANLQPGQTGTLVKNILGYEWDSDVENGFRPAGLINLSLSTVSVEQYLRDYGTSIGPAVVNHSLTMYRAESGALVFGAGTVFWSWGLDDQHEGAITPVDPNVRQSMVNMFADMGIQPQTLDASLIMATQSTDTLRPISSITSPILGATFVEGQRVTITGTAQDFGGGIVAGVEVSTDGGQSWWKATGRENWSYSWIAQANATYTIRSRAVDDSLNLEVPASGTQVTVNLPDTNSIWTFANKPVSDTTLERDGIELGVRFRTSTGGFVQGIRFYKGFYNVGQHIVNLWAADGTLIATGVSTGETLTGWQTVTFTTPVHINSGTTYIASYHTGGYYPMDTGYFTGPLTNGPLTAEEGVYAYTGTPGVFPGNSGGGRNYWVDVVFAPDPNVAPEALNDSGFTIGKNGVLLLSFPSLLANDTDANGDPLTVTAVGNATNGTATLDAQTGNVIFTPTAGYSGPASFTYTVSDGRGGTDTATVTINVEQELAGVSLFQNNEGPAGSAINEGTPMELGMKFTASAGGQVTGIRFFKPEGASGTHTGSLWSSNGTLLATVTFVHESTSGWQTATFSNPVTITQGTTYIASYHTAGTYVADSNYFATAKTNGPLTAPASGASGGNGVFAYGATSFPTASFNSTNYWVDVVFRQSTVNTAPTALNDNFTVINNTPLSLAMAALLVNDTDPDGDQLTVTGVAGATNGSVNFDTQTGMITFTPTGGYTGPASFTYSISDGRGGTSSATVNLTVAPPSTAESLFATSDTPSVAAVDDTNKVELGVKFTVSADGVITGMRYYKSALDTGTHTGSLWTSSGTLLTTATFTNESSSGWQTVTFNQPINVSAGTTYVASYHSNGRYAVTPNYFGTDRTSGSLTAPASGVSGGNGVFSYGANTIFPTSSYNASNYWVDVLFERTQQNRSPVATNDTGYSTGHNAVLSLQATALLSNDTDPDGDPLAVTGVGNAVNGTVSFNAQTNIVTFTPTAGFAGNASFEYTISDGRGGTSTAQAALVVGPNGVQTLFANATPTTVTVDDSTDVELGMKFQADVDGWVSGLRFFKGPQNVGPHEAHLWTASGTLLATATFANETASGWQTAYLSQEVAIQANTTYVVSYHSNGFYSATQDFFTADVTNQDLTAPSSGLSAGNGVFAYGPSGTFPTGSFASTNYYVDVAFRPQLVG